MSYDVRTSFPSVIGRVGALAVALGVGSAVAAMPMAFADDGDTNAGAKGTAVRGEVRPGREPAPGSPTTRTRTPRTAPDSQSPATGGDSVVEPAQAVPGPARAAAAVPTPKVRPARRHRSRTPRPPPNSP